MWNSFGLVKVTTAGTPVEATQNQTDPSARLPLHATLFQQWPTNTGKIYICDRQNAVKATGAGIVAVLAPPTTNLIPSASCTVTFAEAALSLNQFWIDADVNGEGCLVSGIDI